MGMEPPILESREQLSSRWKQEAGGSPPPQPPPTRRESGADMANGEGVKTVPSKNHQCPPLTANVLLRLFPLLNRALHYLHCRCSAEEDSNGFQFTTSLSCWNSPLLFSFYHYHIQVFFYFDLYP